jgi:hypothetical protein
MVDLVRVSPCLAACTVLALVLACRMDPRTPSEIVELYFGAIARDPIRTLPLLTPTFHLAHGLRFEVTRDPPPWRQDQAVDAMEAARLEREAASADPSVELERAKLGWLVALTKPAFLERAPWRSFRHESERIHGDHVDVVVHVHEPQYPSFTATFHLARGSPSESWRIDGIEFPEEIGRVAAFLTAPNASLWQEIREIRARGSNAP